MLVFSEHDKKAGRSNVAQVFRSNDFADSATAALPRSPYQFEYRILYTDYDSIVIINNCIESLDDLDRKRHSYMTQIAVSDVSKYVDDKATD